MAMMTARRRRLIRYFAEQGARDPARTLDPARLPDGQRGALRVATR